MGPTSQLTVPGALRPQYPFNVQDAIVWMADHVDLILIFFDPIGRTAGMAARA